MPFTNYFLSSVLNRYFGNVAYPAPSPFYGALSSTSPTQSAGGSPAWNFTEPSGGGYARIAIPQNAWTPAGTEPTNGWIVVNSAQVQFASSTAPWLAGATLAYFGLFDALTAGNLLAYGALYPTTAVIGPAEQPTFAAGTIPLEFV